MMEFEPVVSRITIYPIKSLDVMGLEKVMITDGGCLLHDREYAIRDEAGNFINGKRNPLVHSLRSWIDYETELVLFRVNDQLNWHVFHLVEEKEGIEAFLGDYFGKRVSFDKNSRGRFMDKPDISGLTVLSTASLEVVSTWYSDLDVWEMRRRFRASLEFEGVPAFWEDYLFSQEGHGIEFKVGEVSMFGMSPRARCVVPTRDSVMGEVTHGFAKTFAHQRVANLPEWSRLGEYGHYYYLSVDCYIPASEVGKWISVGDKVRIVGEKVFY